MVALKLSSTDQKKLQALAEAKGLTPEQAVGYALSETLKRLELEDQAQRFTKAGETLSDEEAERIAVEAVRVVRQSRK